MFQSSFYPLPRHLSSCSSSLLPTDYAPVVDVHRDRLLRFASSRALLPFPLFSISFFFLRQSGSKYTLSLLQRFTVSVFRFSQQLGCLSNSLSFSIRLGSTRLVLSLSHSSSLFSRSRPFSISFHCPRVLLLFVYRVSQKIQFLF